MCSPNKEKHIIYGHDGKDLWEKLNNKREKDLIHDLKQRQAGRAQEFERKSDQRGN